MQRKTAVPPLDKCRMSAFGLRNLTPRNNPARSSGAKSPNGHMGPSAIASRCHQSHASLRGRPKVAVWTATNRCNLNCRFCFGQEKMGELGTENAKWLIEKMKKMGAKYFVFSGGEPLLRKDIFGLAGYAKKIGMKTILHTNGILVNKKNAGKIAKYFDVVNLPVDGANEKTNFLMGRGKLGHTLKIMDLLPEKCKIVISTVATKQNIGEIEKISELLKNKKIRKWRIFKFNPKLGKARKNRKMFEINVSEFEGLKRKINNKKAEFITPESEFEKSYWLIASDGGISECE